VLGGAQRAAGLAVLAAGCGSQKCSPRSRKAGTEPQPRVPGGSGLAGAPAAPRDAGTAKPAAGWRGTGKSPAEQAVPVKVQ